MRTQESEPEIGGVDRTRSVRPPDGPVGVEGGRVLSQADREKAARLIADGQMPVPSDLNPEDLGLVVARVQVLRRDCLIRFLARMIASELRRVEPKP